jgi:hypothetical protein
MSRVYGMVKNMRVKNPRVQKEGGNLLLGSPRKCDCTGSRRLGKIQILSHRGFRYCDVGVTCDAGVFNSVVTVGAAAGVGACLAAAFFLPSDLPPES